MRDDRAAVPLPSARVGGIGRPPPVLVAIGASTGGVAALDAVLEHLRPPAPPIVVIQHMPPAFLGRLVDRFRDRLFLDACLVSQSTVLRADTVHVAGGGRWHLSFVNVSWPGMLVPSAAGEDDLHVPSIDRFFLSVACSPIARDTLAVLLTGMGADGSEGLLQLRQAGARTWVQDPADSTVPSMPAAAIARGAAGRVLERASLGAALAACVAAPAARGRD